jgi:hypothetical protein
MITYEIIFVGVTDDSVVAVNVSLDMEVVSCNSVKYISRLISVYTFKFKMCISWCFFVRRRVFGVPVCRERIIFKWNRRK